MFRASFKEVFKGGLKHINSLSKKVCFVVVVLCMSVVAASRAEGGLAFFGDTCSVSSFYMGHNFVGDGNRCQGENYFISNPQSWSWRIIRAKF